MTTIRLPHVGKGTWPVTVHDAEATVPADTVNWLTGSYKNKGSYATAGQCLGYLKRYAKTNGESFSVWHIYPEDSINPDLPVRWTINVGTDHAAMAAWQAARGGR